MNKNNKLSAAFAVATLAAISTIAPALAGDFEIGCKQYAAKDYVNAQASFEKVVRAYPNFAQAHYYLGNILMSKGKTGPAKAEYQACLNAKPDPTTAQYCQTILSKLGGGGSSSSSSSSSTASASTASTSVASPAAAAAAAGSPDAERRKKQIMDKANQEIAELRKEAQDRRENGNGSGLTTHKYIKPDGSVIYDLSPEERAAAQKECDQKCDKIREMAEYQCKFIK